LRRLWIEEFSIGAEEDRVGAGVLTCLALQSLGQSFSTLPSSFRIYLRYL